MKKFRSASQEEEAEPAVDMSPLIDCVFILLIFFIVTTTFVEERGIEVDKPQPASSADDSDKEPVIFLIRADKKVEQDGREISIGAIQPVVRRAVQKDPETAVIVQVQTRADAGLMVRVVDEAKLAGAAKVNIASP
jgi:biopolymer transport protein ExbD